MDPFEQQLAEELGRIAASTDVRSGSVVDVRKRTGDIQARRRMSVVGGAVLTLGAVTGVTALTRGW